MAAPGAVDPKWGYAGIAALFLLAIAAIALAPFATPPSPNRVAGVVFGFGRNSATTLSAVFAADPDARLVGVRWGGQLVFVSYRDPNFPTKVGRLGAWHTFDAIAAGCHGEAAPDPTSTATPTR